MSDSEPPLAPPPPGVFTNLGENSELWPPVIAVSVISLLVMISAAVLRLYSKALIVKRIHVADYLSLFAVTIMITWTVLYDIACHLGVSKHDWNVRASDFPRIANYLNICDILYGPMLGAAKISILLQLRQHSVSRGTYKLGLKLFNLATGIVITGYYFSCIFQFAFQCIPRRGLWDPSVRPRCGNSAALTFAAAAFGLLTDLMLYTSFIWMGLALGSGKVGGWRCSVPLHAVALFGIMTAAATMYYRLPFLDASVDLTYHVAIVGVWAMAEYAAIILVGCIPSFGAYFKSK